MYVPQTIVGARLIEELPWLISDDTAAWYLDAIGALFQQTAFIVEDQGVDGDPAYQTGYGALFTVNPRFVGDTAICPTDQLGYLGNFVGVPVPPDADDATARSLIANEAGMQRGTIRAILAAAKRWLSATQSVILIERQRPDGSASGYFFTLIVRPEEVINLAELIAAVNAVKPGGVLWQLVQVDGFIWSSAIHTWAADTMTWAAAAATQP